MTCTLPAERYNAALEFLKTAGFPLVTLDSLPADASFRSYHRLKDKNLLLMNAPPGVEDIRPFVAVAEILSKLGFAAPTLHAVDAERGFVLLEDFGSGTFTNILTAENERPLYTLALSVLAALQEKTAGAALPLPPYDLAVLQREVNLLVEWPAPLADTARAGYTALWLPLLNAVATPQKPVLVLRDYHVDNLMLRAEKEGLARCGLLDFQDALLGHPAYDAVSLLQDARRDVPEALEQEFLRDKDAAYTRAYYILGAQRAAKIIGIFHRLNVRDGKPKYLHHIPRTWGYLRRNLVRLGADGQPLMDFLNREFPL